VALSVRLSLEWVGKNAPVSGPRTLAVEVVWPVGGGNREVNKIKSIDVRQIAYPV
jgi:hypothetical protein